MKIAAVCCTYLRPKQLGHLIRCFERQDYADRELVVLDDAGQYEPAAGDRWRLVSVRPRFPTLGEKRNAAAGYVSPDVEALAVWDDDDLYLPWALSASVAAAAPGRVVPAFARAPPAARRNAPPAPHRRPVSRRLGVSSRGLPSLRRLSGHEQRRGPGPGRPLRPGPDAAGRPDLSGLSAFLRLRLGLGAALVGHGTGRIPNPRGAWPRRKPRSSRPIRRASTCCVRESCREFTAECFEGAKPQAASPILTTDN